MGAATVAVVDYRKGNLSSVARGLARAGANPLVSEDPADILRADAAVLPGVGSFADAALHLEASGQAQALREAIAAGKPFLGICLGMQLLFESGDEGALEGETVRGLGVLPGSCVRLPACGMKIPHVGWNQIRLTEAGRSCPLLAGVRDGANMYFTHSYAVDASADEGVIAAQTDYARVFPSVVARGAVFGCQFHPEKSSAAGLAILRNFAQIAARHAEGR